jgi:hypothetical protein
VGSRCESSPTSSSILSRTCQPGRVIIRSQGW